MSWKEGNNVILYKHYTLLDFQYQEILQKLFTDQISTKINSDRLQKEMHSSILRYYLQAYLELFVIVRRKNI